jgi:DNA modification methylase
LKPGRYLVTYAGTFTFDYLKQKLERYLSFKRIVPVKLLGVRNDGYEMETNGKVGTRPVLIFRKESDIDLDVLPDYHIDFKISSAGMDKNYHPWGQSVHEFVQIVEHFSKRGDLVVDPFAGGGTTVEACIQTGRNCKAYDIDAKAFETMKNRFSKYVPLR